MTAMLRSPDRRYRRRDPRSACRRAGLAANDDDSAIVETLTRARLLDDAELMALLFRRADEERIGAAMRARSGRREARVIQGLVSHEDGAVSAAAMALILARGRRRDRFGQSLAGFDDLRSGMRRTAGLRDRRCAANRSRRYPMATPPPMARLVQPRLPLWKIGQKGEVSKHFRTG